MSDTFVFGEVFYRPIALATSFSVHPNDQGGHTVTVAWYDLNQEIHLSVTGVRMFGDAAGNLHFTDELSSYIVPLTNGQVYSGIGSWRGTLAGLIAQPAMVVSPAGVVEEQAYDVLGIYLGIANTGISVSNYLERVVLPNGDVVNLLEGVPVTGTSASETLYGFGRIAALGVDLNDTINAGEGNDIVYALAGNDILNGGGGDDSLYGGGGNDSFDGGDGYDRASLDFSASNQNVSLSVDLTAVNLVQTYLVGGVAAGSVVGVEEIHIVGGSGADRIGGKFGFNLAGASTSDLFGGAGRDVAVVDLSASTTNITQIVPGNASIFLTQDGSGHNLTVNIQDFEVLDFTGGSGNDNISGGNDNDILRGGAGNDRLTGGGGLDVIDGEDGFDWAYFYFGNRSENLTFTFDLLHPESVVTATLDGVSAGSVVGVEEIHIVGGSGADRIGGKFGFNLAGASTSDLFGGAGRDVAVVDLSASTTNITQIVPGNASIFLTQDGSGHSLTVNIQDFEVLDFTGGSGNDNISGGIDNDILRGGAGNDNLHGAGGDDQLYTGSGSDTLRGGAGNDTFYVDSVPAIISEDAGDGNDTVVTTLTVYALPANVENLTRVGAGSFAGIGNALDNVIQGGAAYDEIYGNAGNDILKDAGGAPDALFGGIGDDVFVVSNRFSSTKEFSGEGIDEVQTTFTIYGLQANIENLTFTDNLTHGAGVGNVLNNVLTGGTGIDSLFGRDGNDTLHGGTGSANTLLGQQGDDIYYNEAAGDTVIEMPGEGNDTVMTAFASFTLRSNVENLTYTGLATFTGIGSLDANIMTGGAGADFLDGKDGNDILIGGSGNDIMIGGVGADQFRYAGGETGLDRVLDFVSGTDKIALSSTGFVHTATVDFNHSGAPVATSTNSTFLYNVNNGIVSYDADGTGAGAAVQIAQLNAGLNLAATDFIFY